MMKEIPGLEAIAVTDRDGVPVMKSSSSKDVDQVLRPSLLAATSSSGDQGSKLGIGKCLSVICEYENYQVVSLNKNPFVVTLVANRDTSTGLLLGLQEAFDPLISELSRLIDNA